jgi:hypothetical protein
MVCVLQQPSAGAAVEGIAMPAEAMTITRAGRTYTLTIISRVNSTWCWAHDQFGERWRVFVQNATAQPS